MDCEIATKGHEPWNKGKLVGQKAPFKPKEIWAIRVRLQMSERARELALFNLGIDSKLRACNLTALRVRDICHGDQIASRYRAAAQNATPSAIRDHGACAGRRPSLDPLGAPRVERLSISEPPRPPRSHRYPPVRQGRARLGQGSRIRSGRRWHALHAKDQGVADLQAHEEPACSPAAARTLQN